MYAAVREGHYLFYTLYLIGIGLYEMSADGIGFQYLWPHAVGWNQYAAGFTLYIASSSALFFAASVLNLRRNYPDLFKLQSRVSMNSRPDTNKDVAPADCHVYDH